MVAKCTGIIPIIPDLVSASGMKIGAVYKRVYGFTDLRGRPAGRGRKDSKWLDIRCKYHEGYSYQS